MPVATNDGVDLYILTADGAPMSTFHSSALGVGTPTWTADGKAVTALDKTRFTYMRIDIANPAHRRPVAPRLWQPAIYHGGAMFAALREVCVSARFMFPDPRSSGSMLKSGCRSR